MHTTQLGRESHYYVDTTNLKYIAQHNGDFSGKVRLVAIKADKNHPEGELVVDDFEIPFEMLLVLFGHYKLSVENRRMDRLNVAAADTSRPHLMRDYAVDGKYS